MSLRLQRVESRRDLRRFVDLPRILLGDRRGFVPPLTFEECRRLDPRHNPFFAHATASFWLLYRGRECVGRISAVDDRLARDFHRRPEGVFGHVLARDAEGLARLLGAARDYLAERGLRRMLGPIELSMNYTCGLQISGFDLQPMIDMPQHPEGMDAWMKECGMRKAKDLLAYRSLAEDLDASKLERIAKAAARRFPAEVRTIRNADFDREIRILHEIYLSAWEKNFGFVPMSPEEFRSIAKSFRKIYDPELCLIAERNGKPVGFILALPDANVGIKACGGRLFPLGFLKFLAAMRSCRRTRVITLGLLPEARGKGLDARLTAELIRVGRARGCLETELSWVLEDNIPMVKPILRIGGKEALRYRLYEADFGESGSATATTRSPKP